MKRVPKPGSIACLVPCVLSSSCSAVKLVNKTFRPDKLKLPSIFLLQSTVMYKNLLSLRHTFPACGHHPTFSEVSRLMPLPSVESRIHQRVWKFLYLTGNTSALRLKTKQNKTQKNPNKKKCKQVNKTQNKPANQPTKTNKKSPKPPNS